MYPLYRLKGMSVNISPGFGKAISSGGVARVVQFA